MPSRYQAIIEKIFFDHYEEGMAEIGFTREELIAAATDLEIELPRNVGDVLYSFRFRSDLPDSIIETQPDEKEWIIELAGQGQYRFVLGAINRIVPRDDQAYIDIPDATPELIRAYALGDEQSLLAIVRYNRLIDIFLGLTTYSLQNHLRTTVDGIGQIEIDELYVGLDKYGCHYIIPVQAKSQGDQIGAVQAIQDIRFSETRFPNMRCRAIAVQYMDANTLALFELALQSGQVRVVSEKHYRMVAASDLDDNAVRNYREE